jgi:hypothetical protein
MHMNIEPFLDKHTDKLVSELSELISRELPEDVRCIQVMIFRESLPEVPFWVYFLNRFQSSAKGIKPIELLDNIETLIDSDEYIAREDAICDCLELEDENEQDSCMDSVFEKYNSENQLAAKWFAGCWQKAGGLSLSVPAFIVEEDFQFNPINLKTGQTIKHMSEYNGVFDG